MDFSAALSLSLSLAKKNICSSKIDDCRKQQASASSSSFYLPLDKWCSVCEFWQENPKKQTNLCFAFHFRSCRWRRSWILAGSCEKLTARRKYMHQVPCTVVHIPLSQRNAMNFSRCEPWLCGSLVPHFCQSPKWKMMLFELKCLLPLRFITSIGYPFSHNHRHQIWYLYIFSTYLYSSMSCGKTTTTHLD